MYEAVGASLADESGLILQSTTHVGRGQTNITGPQHVVASTRVDCSADSWTRSECYPELRDSQEEFTRVYLESGAHERRRVSVLQPCVGCDVIYQYQVSFDYTLGRFINEIFKDVINRVVYLNNLCHNLTFERHTIQTVQQ